MLAPLESHFDARIEALERISGPADVAAEIPFDRRRNLLFIEFVARAARDELFARKFRDCLSRLREPAAASVERFLESREIEMELTPDELAVAIAALEAVLAVESPTDASDEDRVGMEVVA